MKILVAVAFFILASNAQAMPADQRALSFYSANDLSIGLIFSEGTNGSAHPDYHRVLEQIYVCQKGKEIATLNDVSTLVDSSGAMIIGKDSSGGTISMERSSEELWLMQSSLRNLKLEEGVTLKHVLSGIFGFEVDWSDRCAPKSAY